MERGEIYDDPRLILEVKMYADGYTDAHREVMEMSDEEVKKALKKYY